MTDKRRFTEQSETRQTPSSIVEAQEVDPAVLLGGQKFSMDQGEPGANPHPWADYALMQPQDIAENGFTRELGSKRRVEVLVSSVLVVFLGCVFLIRFYFSAKSGPEDLAEWAASSAPEQEEVHRVRASDHGAVEEMVKLLKDSKRQLFVEKVSPETGRKVLTNQGPKSAGSLELAIHDISPTERQPLKSGMVRPSVSNDDLAGMGSKSYLVRIELNEQGKVVTANVLDPKADMSFPREILETVRSWQFSPREGAQRGPWVKYFSFKAQKQSN
ncbi:MAG: energy transducer TonB [Acidobacteriota bacterium]